MAAEKRVVFRSYWLPWALIAPQAVLISSVSKALFGGDLPWNMVITGLVIGAVAKLLLPGRDPGGWFVTILLGIAGSWVGQLIFAALGLGNVGIVGAIIGAMMLLCGYRMLKGA